MGIFEELRSVWLASHEVNITRFTRCIEYNITRFIMVIEDFALVGVMKEQLVGIKV